MDNPQYKLIPNLKTSRVSPEDQVEVDFFLTGYGTPEKSKLYVNLASLKLSQETVRLRRHIVKEIDGKNIKGKTQERSPKNLISFENGESAGPTKLFWTGLHQSFFRPVPLEEVEDKDYPPVFGELMQLKPPLLTLRFSLDEDINPGDYEMRFALTTGTKNRVDKVDIKTINVHVMTPYERNKLKVNVALIVIAFLSLLFTIYQAGLL